MHTYTFTDIYMASAVTPSHGIFPVSFHSPRSYRNRNLVLTPSQLLPHNSLLQLKNQTLSSAVQINRLNSRRNRSTPLVFASQSGIFRVLQTVLKVGKDGVEAGTNLVPDSVPRPIARISVTVVGGLVALFVLKSFVSTAFFVLGMMGLIYLAFISLNKDEGPKGGGGGSGGTTSTEDSLEEARRIMEKYK